MSIKTVNVNLMQTFDGYDEGVNNNTTKLAAGSGYLDEPSQPASGASHKAPAKIPNLYLSKINPLLPAQELHAEKIAHKLTHHLNYSTKDAYLLAVKIAAHTDFNSSGHKKFTRRKDNLPKGILIKNDKLVIHEKLEIGQGVCKRTYIATQMTNEMDQIEKIVHQKVKDPEKVQMLEDEVNIQKRFDHPHIVKIYDSIRYSSHRNPSQEQISIYAEFCSSSLQEAIWNEDLDLQEKALIAADIASALGYVHEQGYSHNDIKPDNILIKARRGKLTDFGLSKPIGSPFHHGFKKIFAPEQLFAYNTTGSASLIANDKTDVYQFGLTLWHLFHPNPPSEHLRPLFTYPDELFGTWPIQTAEDQMIQTLITSCLNKDPALRPSMKEIEDTLRKLA